MKNGQVLIGLMEYFKQQDQETVCMGLAGAMIDLHQWLIFGLLTEEHRQQLIERTVKTVESMMELTDNGFQGRPLTVSTMPKKEKKDD